MRNRTVYSWALLGALSLGGGVACSKKEGATSTEKAAVTVAKPGASQPVPLVPEPLASTQEVEAFLSKWLQSQNEGDFEGYSALYAKKFTGIKRSAERERKFNHADWLSDRAGMFKKPFTVSASNVEINATPGLVIVSLEQRWKSDSYEDSGKKQLLLVREDKQLAISREEMLESKALGEDTAVPARFEQAALVRRTLRSFALLVPGPVDLDWASEHPVYISDEENERAVSLPAVPPATRALLDVAYEVFDESGQRCAVKPTTLKLLTYVIPHFGTVNFWNDFDAQYEGRRPVPQPPAARALSLWGMVESQGSGTRGRTLAVEFEAHASCPKPVWGRKVAPAAASPALVRAANAAELAEVGRALLIHPAIQELDRELVRTLVEPKGYQPTIVPGSARVVDAGQGREFVYVVASGLGGCGYGTPESVGLLWRRQNGKLAPYAQALYFDGTIRAAIDLDGDGELEFIGKDVIVRRGKTGYSSLIDHSPLFLDCGC